MNFYKVCLGFWNVIVSGAFGFSRVSIKRVLDLINLQKFPYFTCATIKRECPPRSSQKKYMAHILPRDGKTRHMGGIFFLKYFGLHAAMFIRDK